MAGTAIHVSGAGTFCVSDSPGAILVGININTPGGTIVAYDNTVGSGPVLGSWTTATGHFPFGNVPLTTGLTFVTTGSPDITSIFA
jgi:hypothetical protein